MANISCIWIRKKKFQVGDLRLFSVNIIDNQHMKNKMIITPAERLQLADNTRYYYVQFSIINQKHRIRQTECFLMAGYKQEIAVAKK